MKIKKSILIFSSIVLALIVSSVILLSAFKSEKNLFGTFEYVDESGDKSVIKVEEDLVYIENADYENIEKFEATLYLFEMNAENDTTEEMTREEREQKKAELCDSWDFKNEFDKKRLSVIKKYEDSSDENVVVWIASTSEEKLSEGIRIRINMDRENRTCFLFGGPGGTYNYVGK